MFVSLSFFFFFFYQFAVASYVFISSFLFFLLFCFGGLCVCGSFICGITCGVNQDLDYFQKHWKRKYDKSSVLARLQTKSHAEDVDDDRNGDGDDWDDKDGHGDDDDDNDTSITTNTAAFVFRFIILQKYGGAYQDFDVMWSSHVPDWLLTYPAVVCPDWVDTSPWPQTFNQGVMMARKGSAYLQQLLRSFKDDYRDKDWNYNGAMMPNKVIERYPDTVFIYNRLQVMILEDWSSNRGNGSHR